MYFYRTKIILLYSNILFHSNFPTFVLREWVFCLKKLEVGRLIAALRRRGKSGHQRVA